MKTILVPTDFSENSSAAYDYAVMLAEKRGATIYLLHIIEAPFESPSPDGDNNMIADANYMMEVMRFTKLRMAKLKSNKLFKNTKVVDIIEVGSVPSKIYQVSKKYKADMIVIDRK